MRAHRPKRHRPVSKKWIGTAVKHHGALHRQLRWPMGKKIPTVLLQWAAKQPGKLGARARFAITAKKFHHGRVILAPEDEEEEEALMFDSEDYILGCDVLGEDTIPQAGATYTDAATVRAVQSALKAKGFDPQGIDGVMGPHTAAAIRSMQSATGAGQTGVIDYGVLMALGVSVPSSSTSAPAVARSSSSSGPYAQIVPSAPGAPAAVAMSGLPAWKIAAVAGGAAAILGGIVVLVRR